MGSPMASRIMAMVRTPPAGTPAAPTLDAVAVTLGDGTAGSAMSPEHRGDTETCRTWQPWLGTENHTTLVCRLHPRERIHFLQVMNSCCPHLQMRHLSHGKIVFMNFFFSFFLIFIFTLFYFTILYWFHEVFQRKPQ